MGTNNLPKRVSIIKENSEVFKIKFKGKLLFKSFDTYEGAEKYSIENCK